MPIINMVYKKNKWWKPWANTLAYYPLDSTNTVNDLSWNNKTLSNTWVTFWTYNWVDCANYSWDKYLYRNQSLISWSQNFTINMWYLRWGASHNHSEILSIGSRYWSNSFMFWLNDSDSLYIWWWDNDRNTWYVTQQWQWVNVVCSHNNWTAKVYINGVLQLTATVSYSITSSWTGIWWWFWWDRPIIWNISKFIVESMPRTAQEVADYYNLTKWNYWL